MTSTQRDPGTPESSGVGADSSQAPAPAAGAAVAPATAEPPATPESASIHVRYFAGARAAAGIAEETVSVTAAPGRPVTAADVIEAVLTVHGQRLADVVPSCSFLLNGVAVRDRNVPVPAGAEFDVLPPFAGG